MSLGDIPIDYTYDKARRLLTVSRNSTRVAEYIYNALGQRTNLYFGPNQTGAHTDYTFDGTTRWLTGVSNITSTGGTVSSFTYELDKTGQRTKMTYANGDYVNYAYDAAYHLTGEQRTGNINYVKAWTYDDVGNRLAQGDGTITTTYSYNTANQLITEACGTATTYYNFDANGNQTAKGNGTNITYTWTFNYDNRIISYYDPLTSVNNTTYKIDAMGRRIEKNKNGTVTRFLLDGANVIVDYNSAGNPTAQYVTPFLDQNLIISKSNATYYYMQDGLGSVVNLIDTNQATKNTYEYNAFGESVSASQQVTQRYRFAGREWDFESGTYYNNFRQYNQATGRFNRRDPIGYLAGINLYRYCYDNPVIYFDPFGLAAEERKFTVGYFTTVTWKEEVVRRQNKYTEDSRSKTLRVAPLSWVEKGTVSDAVLLQAIKSIKFTRDVRPDGKIELTKIVKNAAVDVAIDTVIDKGGELLSKGLGKAAGPVYGAFIAMKEVFSPDNDGGPPMKERYSIMGEGIKDDIRHKEPGETGIYYTTEGPWNMEVSYELKTDKADDLDTWGEAHAAAVTRLGQLREFLESMKKIAEEKNKDGYELRVGNRKITSTASYPPMLPECRFQGTFMEAKGIDGSEKDFCNWIGNMGWNGLQLKK